MQTLQIMHNLHSISLSKSKSLKSEFFQRGIDLHNLAIFVQIKRPPLWTKILAKKHPPAFGKGDTTENP